MKCGLHFRRACFSYTDAGSHNDACLSLHAQGNFVSRASTLPCGSVHSHVGADPHTIKNFLNHTPRLILRMLLLLRSREARGGQGPALPGLPLSPYAGAKRRVKFRRSRTPLSPYARAQHGGEVRLRTLLSLRTGIPLSLSSEPGPEAGQFQQGGFLICAALPLRRSQPERRICARPLRKRAGADPQSRSRRGGLTRLAVCTVPAWLSPHRTSRIGCERELQTERQDAPPTGPFSPGRQLLPLLLSILLWRRRKVATLESYS